MLRERLSVSGERLGEEHREQDEDYVYDLYYQETVTPGWIQDILSVRAYADEGELVCVDGWTDRWMSAEIGVSEWRHGWTRVDLESHVIYDLSPLLCRSVAHLFKGF